jgi:DNA-binding NarL/FixJ family response regulator
MFERRIDILVVDDHPLVRESLLNLIHQQPDLRVSGEADNVQDALALIKKTRPAVAIVDISLKGSSGLELIHKILEFDPKIATIVLSMHEERHYAERAIRAGARGYVTKSETPKRIIAAIREVLAGKLGVSQDVANLFARRYFESDGKTLTITEKLSNRELEVFRLLGEGVDTHGIAEALHISFKTVHAYCARIKEKLDLANATELLREAVRWTEGSVS